MDQATSQFQKTSPAAATNSNRTRHVHHPPPDCKLAEPMTYPRSRFPMPPIILSALHIMSECEVGRAIHSTAFSTRDQKSNLLLRHGRNLNQAQISKKERKKRKRTHRRAKPSPTLHPHHHASSSSKRKRRGSREPTS